MLVDGPNEVYMIDRDKTVFHVPNLQVRFEQFIIIVDGPNEFYIIEIIQCSMYQSYW